MRASFRAFWWADDPGGPDVVNTQRVHFCAGRYRQAVDLFPYVLDDIEVQTIELVVFQTERYAQSGEEDYEKAGRDVVCTETADSSQADHARRDC